tara:strand:+ start:2971 stop:3153 length:183 start_codon:yes stop_codon:yes gene_type:complete
MLDWVWRLLGYKLDKDLIRKHQLERAKIWEDNKTTPKKLVVPITFSKCVIEKKPKTGCSI